MVNEEFEKIYKNTYNYLLRFIVIKCYNINDINDIIQDTYIELYKIMKKNNKTIDNYNAFICGIATNIIKRHYYKKNRILLFQSNEDNDVFYEFPDDFDLEQNIINKENVEKVWNHIKSKDINTGKIFYLYFGLDEKISDISNELNIKESTVKSKIYRTLKEVKNKLEKEEENYE